MGGRLTMRVRDSLGGIFTLQPIFFSRLATRDKQNGVVVRYFSRDPCRYLPRAKSELVVRRTTLSSVSRISGNFFPLSRAKW